jgi:hypothetical protein
MENINDYMPWIVALLIGILTVLANWFISKNQRKITLENLKIQTELAKQSIKKDILSKNRQEWINTLRNDVASYLSSHELAKLIVKHDKKGNDTPPEYREEFKNFQSLEYKINLLVNPNEDKSNKLIGLMKQLNLSTGYYSNDKENDYENTKEEIIKTTQSILKEEWERVKNLE